MLAYRIQLFRRNSGMNQRQLAERLGVSASTIGMYEQNRRIPDISILVAMANIFDVSLDYLITGAEHQSATPSPDVRTPKLCPCSTCYWKSCKE